jgi:hypothetical protein
MVLWKEAIIKVKTNCLNLLKLIGAIDAFNKALSCNKDPTVSFFSEKQILLMKAGAQYVMKQWDDALASTEIFVNF